MILSVKFLFGKIPNLAWFFFAIKRINIQMVPYCHKFLILKVSLLLFIKRESQLPPTHNTYKTFVFYH